MRGTLGEGPRAPPDRMRTYIYTYVRMGSALSTRTTGGNIKFFKASLQIPQRCFTCAMAEGGRDRPVRHRDAYRKYLRDASLPLPRMTQWRRRKAMDM